MRRVKFHLHSDSFWSSSEENVERVPLDMRTPTMHSELSTMEAGHIAFLLKCLLHRIQPLSMSQWEDSQTVPNPTKIWPVNY